MRSSFTFAKRDCEHGKWIDRARRKGERRGGREKGTPNKFSAQRVEVFGRQGRKRPDEELVDLFYYCRGQAARFQAEVIDRDTGEYKANPEADIVEHGKWIDRAREVARDAAPYYAAKLAAVAFGGNITVTEDFRPLLRRRCQLGEFPRSVDASHCDHCRISGF